MVKCKARPGVEQRMGVGVGGQKGREKDLSGTNALEVMKIKEVTLNSEA